MIFQHGNDSTDYHQAYKLARTAVKLDTTNESARWLTAATWDRYLLSTGKPQWYGTQYLTLDGTTYLRQIDTSRIDDETRKRYGVRTLDEIRSRLKKLNGEDQGLPQLPDSIRARSNF